MKWLDKYLLENRHIAPLVTFRILFGSIMFAGIVRFMLKGWVHEQYIAPKYHFSYYGFEWVKPLGSTGMYLLFGLMAAGFLFIALGWFYRSVTILTFLTFTYVELIDKTNYLNHYYFVSIVTFLLIFVPANRYFSIDNRNNPARQLIEVPAWTILLFQFQLGIVYFFAGMAKLNADWLVQAMPLKIWLTAYTDLPLIGPLLARDWVAYFFSWTGAAYDLSIPFLLSINNTRKIAFACVVGFHLMTALLFPIGMFPYIMIAATLIYFSPSFHQQLLGLFSMNRSSSQPSLFTQPSHFYWLRKPLPKLLLLFFTIQLFMPFRFLFYPGNTLWTEEGYRFSWRVMLMEKAGHAIFHVEDPETGRRWEVKNYEFLTPNQEKMMATQPDMILQFAHYLKCNYRKKGIEKTRISVENYVTLNGRESRMLIDPEVDLTLEKESFSPKKWILPFNDSN